MEKKLQLLLHLYGDVEDPKALEELLRDENCQAEYAALRSVKEALDVEAEQRRAQRTPDPAVEEKVLELAQAAQPAAQRPGPRLAFRRMKAPIGTARMRKVTGWASLALAAAISGIIFWPAGNDVQPPLGGQVVPSAEATQGPNPNATGFGPWQRTEPGGVPPWDEGAQIVDMHRHLEILRSRSEGDAWDEPELLRIDSLPAADPGAGITPARVTQ